MAESTSGRRPAAMAIPSSTDPITVFFLAGLFSLFVAHYAVLIGAVFELFRAVDFLANAPAAADIRWTVRLPLLILVALLLVRIAWHLALAIVGLVTHKYDEASTTASAVSIDADRYQALYQAVADVCRTVEAPVPDEIRISANAECYVVEERRFALRTARRLILVLGFPQLLVATTAELRVILAHEMAHFRRGHTTRVLFLFRFAESLRVAIETIQGRWWRWIDPIHWFCLVIYRLFVLLSAPVQRRQELRADCVSAAYYGSDVAVHTLLKDWLLENQFETAVDDFVADQRNAEPKSRGSVYQLFADRWREYSSASEEYLERRLTEEERAGFFDPLPTIHSRVAAMRKYPPAEEVNLRPASHLLDDVASLEFELQQRLLGNV